MIFVNETNRHENEGSKESGSLRDGCTRFAPFCLIGLTRLLGFRRVVSGCIHNALKFFSSAVDMSHVMTWLISGWHISMGDSNSDHETSTFDKRSQHAQVNSTNIHISIELHSTMKSQHRFCNYMWLLVWLCWELCCPSCLFRSEFEVFHNVGYLNELVQQSQWTLAETSFWSLTLFWGNTEGLICNNGKT